MDTPSPSMRRLAQRLLAVEAASQTSSGATGHEVVQVCEKLRTSLTRFAGADGFKSLLRRALALARAEAPGLKAVTLKPDGSLDGFDILTTEETNGTPAAALAITSQLLGLLVTFIGEPITLRLVRDAWPDACLEE